MPRLARAATSGADVTRALPIRVDKGADLDIRVDPFITLINAEFMHLNEVC